MTSHPGAGTAEAEQLKSMVREGDFYKYKHKTKKYGLFMHH
jgi:hypothetical protein